MMRGSFKWVPEPPPKPVSTTKWIPAAANYKLNICWDVLCVGTAAGAEHHVTKFWGESFEAQDVGACVMAVVAEIKRLAREVTL